MVPVRPAVPAPPIAADAADDLPGLGERQRLVQQPQPVPPRGQPRVRRAAVQRRRNDPVVQGERGLHQARDAGRTGEVADVALDRPDGARPPAPSLVHRGQRAGLHRVGLGDAVGVRLDERDVHGQDAGAFVGGADGLGLPPPVGRRGRPRAAVVPDHAAADRGVHPLPVGQGAVEPPEHDQSRPLARGAAVGAEAERLAAAVGGDRVGVGGARGVRVVGAREHVHAGDQRVVALAQSHRVAGQVHGHQRGRARGVDRQARAPQVEMVGEPAGRRVVAAPGARPADVNGGPAAGERGRVHPGVLDRVPGALQQQPGAGLHFGRLPRPDAEERAVEAVRVLDAAGSGGLPPAHQQFPELVLAGGPGEAAGHADHRHRGSLDHQRTSARPTGRAIGSSDISNSSAGAT
nr:hypothetical protein [Actinomadura sp. CNU-125]